MDAEWLCSICNRILCRRRYSSTAGAHQWNQPRGSSSGLIQPFSSLRRRRPFVKHHCLHCPYDECM